MCSIFFTLLQKKWFFIQNIIITLTRWIWITVIIIKYIKKSKEISATEPFIIIKIIIQTTILKDFHLDDFICESKLNEKMQDNKLY